MKTVSIVAQGASIFDFINDCTDNGGLSVSDETWAINAVGGVIRHDLLFHMDDCHVQEGRENRAVKKMLSWLRDHPRFMTSRKRPGYDGAIEYPLQDVVRCVGFPYLNSTPAFALAYAIYRGFEGIRLYGCDFTYPDSHKAEKGRACMEFLIGIAMSRGIAVHTPKHATLLDTCDSWQSRIYGYDAYDMDWEVTADGWSVSLSDKPLPSGQEIEARYAYPKESVA